MRHTPRRGCGCQDHQDAWPHAAQAQAREALMPDSGWRCVIMAPNGAKVCGWLALREVTQGEHAGWFEPILLVDQVLSLSTKPVETVSHWLSLREQVGLWEDPIAFHEFMLEQEGWSLGVESQIVAY
jgi:hypothetical protein